MISQLILFLWESWNWDAVSALSTFLAVITSLYLARYSGRTDLRKTEFLKLQTVVEEILSTLYEMKEISAKYKLFMNERSELQAQGILKPEFRSSFDQKIAYTHALIQIYLSDRVTVDCWNELELILGQVGTIADNLARFNLPQNRFSLNIKGSSVTPENAKEVFDSLHEQFDSKCTDFSNKLIDIIDQKREGLKLSL